jgi:hypothetical protein
MSNESESESESELLYDWKLTASLFVLETSPLRLTARIYIFQLNTCDYSPYVTSSLTRRCLSFTTGAGPRRRIHSPESRGTRDHILLSQIRNSPNLEGQDPVFIPPGNRVARLYPQAQGSFFVASYDSQDCCGSTLTRLHTGYAEKLNSPKLN